MAKEDMKLVANNKKAYHDYFIEENTKPDWFCMELR